MVKRLFRKISYCISYFLLLPVLLLAQDSSVVADSRVQPITIDRIVIRGNQVTKDYIILREMSLKPGDTLSLKVAEFDKNRIYSLGLFNRVELSYVVNDQTATLYVDVSERWYIFPFLVFGAKDRDWKKLYYGLGILHNNFRGRNEKLSAAFALGYDPFFTIRYRNPILSLESNLFCMGKIFYSRVRNKSIVAQQLGPNFDEEYYGFEATLGKRFNIFRFVSLSLGYQVLTVSENKVGRTLSASGRDAFFTGRLGFLHDSRDLAEYPSRGTYFGVLATKYGFGETVVNYFRLAGDVRKFVPTVGGAIIAGRVFSSVAAGGTVPNYGHVFFGYEERIRGHFREIFEGENILGSSLELRLPILSPRFVSIEAIPVPQFGLWRFGIYGTLFADAGKVWYRDDPFTLHGMVKGYGVGLNFLLPYSAVLRLEYALNEAQAGEVIFDIVASF